MLGFSKHIYAVLALSLGLQALSASAQGPFIVSASGDADDSQGSSSTSSGTSRSSTSSTSPSSATRSSASKAAQSSASSSSKDTSRIKMTLARMPYEQIMCDDSSKVMNGATLNVSWTSKGKLSNSLYVRTAVDKYNNWLPFPTFPPFTGKKDGDGDDDDPAATYRLTFQYTVYAYQKGVMFTIGQHDNEQNQTISTLNSKKLSIVHSCELRNDTLEEDTSSVADSAEPSGGQANATGEAAWRLPLPPRVRIASTVVLCLSLYLTHLPL